MADLNKWAKDARELKDEEREEALGILEMNIGRLGAILGDLADALKNDGSTSEIRVADDKISQLLGVANGTHHVRPNRDSGKKDRSKPDRSSGRNATDNTRSRNETAHSDVPSTDTTSTPASADDEPDSKPATPAEKAHGNGNDKTSGNTGKGTLTDRIKARKGGGS